MALCAQNEQSARFQNLLLFCLDFSLERNQSRLFLGALFHLAQFLLGAELQIAAKLNIRAAARHIGGNGHRAQPASLRHNIGFALMLASVQNLVFYTLFIEEAAEQFRFLNRYCADQNRLPDFVLLANSLGNRFKLVVDRFEELIFLIDPRNGFIGWDFSHVELVDVPKFGCFCRRCAGHACQLWIHTEIVLEGDRGHRLVFRLNRNAFLGLCRLVQAIGPTPPIHHPASKLVDDDDLIILHDIADVALEHDVRFERLVEVMDNLGVFYVVEIVRFEQACIAQFLLNRIGAFFGPSDVLGLFISLIPFRIEVFDDGINRYIKIGLIFCWARDNQRGPRFVDQDRIHLVDDCKVKRTLHHLRAFVLHIVAQIIETEFVIRAVSNVGVIGFTASKFIEIGNDHAHAQPHKAVNLPHPIGIAASKVVIDRDDMDALALNRVEIGRERRHKRLTLARAHFGNLAAMEHNAAYHLRIEMPHAEHSNRGFAHRCKGFGQDIVERFALGEHPAKLVSLRRQFSVRQRLDLIFERFDLSNNLAHGAHITVVG